MNSNVKISLRNILERYDVNKMKNDKKFSNYRYYKLILNRDDMNDIVLYDDKKKIITKSKVQLLSIYIPNIRLWKWGWSLLALKKDVYASRKILSYVLDINDFDKLFLREPLLDSNITIRSQLELDLLIGMSSYITKQNCIMGFYEIPDEEKIKGDLCDIKDVEKREDKDNYMIKYYILMEE